MNIEKIKRSIRQKIFDYTPDKQNQALDIIEKIKTKQGFDNDYGYNRNSIVLGSD